MACSRVNFTFRGVKWPLVAHHTTAHENLTGYALTTRTNTETYQKLGFP
jgi:hypothetical protein